MRNASRRSVAIVLAAVAWCRARAQAIAARTPTRMRVGGTRAQTDSKTVVATGAAVAGSGGLVALIRDYWLGGALYQISLSTVNAIQSLGTFTQVFSAFGSNVADLVGAAIPVAIVDAGVFASASAIRADFGISGFLIGIIVTMLGVGLFMWFLINIDWSPLQLLRGRN